VYLSADNPGPRLVSRHLHEVITEAEAYFQSHRRVFCVRGEKVVEG
jgi:hypothetical protein